MPSSVEVLSFANGLSGGTSAVEGILHELSALSIFAFSFILWHYAKTHGLHGVAYLSPKAMKTANAMVQQDKGPHRPLSQQQADLSKAAKAPAQGSVEEVEKQILQLLQQKEFTRALCLFRSLERTGREHELKNEDMFSSFLVSAIRVEKLDILEKMLRVAKGNGIELTLKSWQTVLKMLSTKKQFSACLLAYSIFDKKIPADQVVFSCLINAALENRKPQEALKMLNSYRKTDLFPKEWVLFFRTYVMLGDVDQAEATFYEAGPNEITPLMLNLLILTCVNVKQLDRAKKCLQKAHEIEQGRDSKIVNVVSYNTIMKGFLQQGQLEHCFACLQQLIEHGIEPDETTVGMIVDICLQDNCVSIADRFMKALSVSGTESSTVMCTNLLKLLIKTDRLEDASELYKEMQHSKQAQPDIVTYSMLIKAYIDANKFDLALRISDDMLAAGCKPDDMILTRLLDGCRQVGQSSRGVEIFEHFVEIGVVPSDLTILTLLKLLGSTGNHGAAYEFVAMCQQRFGTTPSVIHYTCLMSGALRHRSYEEAWQAYLLMIQHDVQPDATSISTLLPGLVAAQHWERALEIVSAALKDAQPPLKVPAEMLNNALSQMIAASVPRQHIHRFQLLMRGAGIPITDRNSKRIS